MLVKTCPMQVVQSLVISCSVGHERPPGQMCRLLRCSSLCCSQPEQRCSAHAMAKHSRKREIQGSTCFNDYCSLEQSVLFANPAKFCAVKVSSGTDAVCTRHDGRCRRPPGSVRPDFNSEQHAEVYIASLRHLSCCLHRSRRCWDWRGPRTR